jgi:hypothetical protein
LEAVALAVVVVLLAEAAVDSLAAEPAVLVVVVPLLAVAVALAVPAVLVQAAVRVKAGQAFLVEVVVAMGKGLVVEMGVVRAQVQAQELLEPAAAQMAEAVEVVRPISDFTVAQHSPAEMPELASLREGRFSLAVMLLALPAYSQAAPQVVSTDNQSTRKDQAVALRSQTRHKLLAAPLIVR